MPKPESAFDYPARPGTPLPARNVSRVPVVAFSMGLGTFLVVTYLFLVLFDLWFPTQAVNQVWAPLLPGFTWLTWPSFFLGLIEVFAYGWLVGLVFGPLYNVCLANSYYLCKSPSFHRLVNPGANGTIGVHA